LGLISLFAQQAEGAIGAVGLLDDRRVADGGRADLAGAGISLGVSFQC
jgi:hypothetical protein